MRLMLILSSIDCPNSQEELVEQRWKLWLDMVAEPPMVGRKRVTQDRTLAKDSRKTESG
jgi:hypothetical protein